VPRPSTVRGAWRKRKSAIMLDLLIGGMAAYTAVGVVQDAAAGAVARVVVDLLFLGWCAWTLRWRVRRYFRPGEVYALRRQLVAEARKIRSREAWLNRAERLIFSARNGIEGTRLRVVSEDDLEDAVEHGGAVMTVTYVMPRLVDDVLRHVDGVRYRLDPGGEARAVPEGNGEFAQWRDAWKMVGFWRSGLMDADRGELRLILTQLRDAERLDGSG
jgi:hypothetical protein